MRVKSIKLPSLIIAATSSLALSAGAWCLSARSAPAPAATFATVGGESVSLASLRGKVVR